MARQFEESFPSTQFSHTLLRSSKEAGLSRCVVFAPPTAVQVERLSRSPSTRPWSNQGLQVEAQVQTSKAVPLAFGSEGVEIGLLFELIN